MEGRIRDLLAAAAARLAPRHESARLDAEVLLAHALGRTREYLLARPEHEPADDARARFAALIERRAAGVPVAHLTGRREFWSLALEVTPDTLIPRPETELLVECALALLPTGRAMRVADLGTGSGAVAIAIARERPRAQVVASDLSPAVLAVAARNVARHTPGRVILLRSDWCEALGERPFDLLVCNPPYVAEGDPHLAAGDAAYEPRLALTGGADGLDAIRLVAATAAPCLVPGGHLLLEHGHAQGAAVRALLAEAGFLEPRTYRDLAGHERVTAARTR